MSHCAVENCGRKFGKGGCYPWYSPQRKTQLAVCPQCYERLVMRSTKEEFEKSKKLNHREQLK